MIIKGLKRGTTSWANIFSTLRKNSLLRQGDKTHSEKTNLKQLVFAVFSAFFLCAFFAVYMINKNPQIIIKIANARTAEKVFKAITLGPFRWMGSHIRGADLSDVYIDIKFKYFTY